MLTIQNTEQLNCTSPCVIMSTVYLRTEGGIGHLSCQSIVLIKGHIVGRISNALGIEQILVVEQYPCLLYTSHGNSQSQPSLLLTVIRF